MEKIDKSGLAPEQIESITQLEKCEAVLMADPATIAMAVKAAVAVATDKWTWKTSSMAISR